MKTPPRYFWQQNYEVGDGLHWALNDTHSAQEGKVSCYYMVLLADYPTCMDGKPLSEQEMPKRIIDALNEGVRAVNGRQALIDALNDLLIALRDAGKEGAPSIVQAESKCWTLVQEATQ